MKPFERRRKHFCDQEVQGALLRQLVYYWLLGSGTVVLFTIGYQLTPLLLSGDIAVTHQIWGRLVPILLASAAIAPIVVVSAVRFSNRFVGPMLRFRRVLQDLAEGKVPNSPIVLRDKDYWTDVATAINAISSQMEQRSEVTDHGVERKQTIDRDDQVISLDPIIEPNLDELAALLK